MTQSLFVCVSDAKISRLITNSIEQIRIIDHTRRADRCKENRPKKKWIRWRTASMRTKAPAVLVVFVYCGFNVFIYRQIIGGLRRMDYADKIPNIHSILQPT